MNFVNQIGDCLSSWWSINVVHPKGHQPSPPHSFLPFVAFRNEFWPLLAALNYSPLGLDRHYLMVTVQFAVEVAPPVRFCRSMMVATDRKCRP
jgi:hypothetical protein